MENKQEILSAISFKLISGIPLNEEEVRIWNNWKRQPHIQQYLKSREEGRWARFNQIKVPPWEEFCQKMGIKLPAADPAPGVSILRRMLQAAAIILICFLTGWFLLFNWHKSAPTQDSEGQHHPVNRNTVRLIAPDQSEFTLNVSTTSINIDQGNLIAIIENDGKLRFKKGGAGSRHTGYYKVITSAGVSYPVELSDGSTVMLNNKSELWIPADFGQKTRNVELKGEGYFNIQQDPLLPFLVKAGNTVQKVLGTEFNISAYENDSLITTSLINGKLAVVSDRGQIILNKGQQAVYNAYSKIFETIPEPDIEYANAWKSGYFTKGKTNILLTNLLRRLERWYDVKLIPKGTITNEMLTIGRISRSTPVDSVLSILQGPGDFKYTKSDDEYYIENAR